MEYNNLNFLTQYFGKNMLNVILLGLFLSFVFTLIIYYYKNIYGGLILDNSLGPQKIHNIKTPRIGGLAILLTVLCQAIILPEDIYSIFSILIIISLPSFLIGFLEDLTKNISPIWRLLGTLISALMFLLLVKNHIRTVGIESIDNILLFYPIYIIVTIFAIAGFSQSINIIDGINGLSSGYIILVLLILSWLANTNEDILIFKLTLLFASAIFGFWLLNALSGLVFLGDGGAYFIGVLCASLIIIFSYRNDNNLSFACLILVLYPVYETIRSMFRRLLNRNLKIFNPDTLHLHSLIHHAFKFYNISSLIYRNVLVLFFCLIPSIVCFLSVLFLQYNLQNLFISIFTFIFVYESMIFYYKKSIIKN